VFDHVGIRVSDQEASERFYDAVLSVLGKQRVDGEDYTEWEHDFDIGTDGPTTRRLHIGFYAPTHELVDAFHRAVLPRAVERAGGSVQVAAERLGIPRASLYRMLQQLRGGSDPDP